MKFTFDGENYVIEFARATKERPAHVQKNRRPDEGPRRSVVTTARILRVVNETLVGGIKASGKQIVREATVSHYHKDRFTLDGGRKAALALAMYDAPTKGGGAPLLGKPLTKEFRTAVWEAYHDRFIPVVEGKIVMTID